MEKDNSEIRETVGEDFNFKEPLTIQKYETNTIQFFHFTDTSVHMIRVALFFSLMILLMRHILLKKEGLGLIT